jgi:hypothetical protein
MLVNDDPNASAATVAVLSVASVAFAAFAVVVYRPLLSPPSTGPQVNRPVAAGPSTLSSDVPREDDETAGSTPVHEGM